MQLESSLFGVCVIQLKPHAYGCEEKRYCLMAKEEMFKDGQDEPVTSMPEIPRRESINGTQAKEVPNAVQYPATDPIMNAPSC